MTTQLDSIIELTEANFVEQVLQQPEAIVLDFWAPWCAPCRAMGENLEQFAGEQEGRIRVGKINVDEQPRLAAQFNIRSIPTLVFFKDGAVRDRSVGALGKSALDHRVELLGWVD